MSWFQINTLSQANRLVIKDPIEALHCEIIKLLTLQFNNRSEASAPVLFAKLICYNPGDRTTNGGTGSDADWLENELELRWDVSMLELLPKLRKAITGGRRWPMLANDVIGNVLWAVVVGQRMTPWAPNRLSMDDDNIWHGPCLRLRCVRTEMGLLQTNRVSRPNVNQAEKPQPLAMVFFPPIPLVVNFSCLTIARCFSLLGWLLGYVSTWPVANYQFGNGNRLITWPIGHLAWLVD